MIISKQDLEVMSLVGACMDRCPPKDRVHNHNVIKRSYTALLDRMQDDYELRQIETSELENRLVFALMLVDGPVRGLPEIFLTEQAAIDFMRTVIHQRGHLSDLTRDEEQQMVVVKDLTDPKLIGRITPLQVLG